MLKNLHKTLRTASLCIAAVAAVTLGVMNAQAARIPLGALTTLNTSTHLDPMFTELYDLREQITTPGYTAATPKWVMTTGGSIRLPNDQQIEFGGGTNSLNGNGSTNTVSLWTNNTRALTVTSAQNVLAVAGPLGYGTGAGGTVTQATSKSTSVTLNKASGQITMNGAALAAGASVNFLVNNSLVSRNDVPTATTVDDFGGNYTAQTMSTWDGYFIIRVTNITGGSLSQAVRVNFAIIKGATS